MNVDTDQLDEKSADEHATVRDIRATRNALKAERCRTYAVELECVSCGGSIAVTANDEPIDPYVAHDSC